MNAQPMPVRVALLYGGRHHHIKVVQLLTYLAGETVEIKLDRATLCLPKQLAGCDLILFEALGPINNEQEAALHWLRAGNYAPVVMLTTGIRSEQAIDGLIAGADAVIPLTTSHEVIVAHCQALMRRWRTLRFPASSTTH